MGRGRRGGRSPSEFKFKELHRRIALSKLSDRPLDDLVQDLRVKYHDYARQKLNPFTNLVREALASPHHSSGVKRVGGSESWRALSFEGDSEVEEVRLTSLSRKKLKKTDNAEERLQRMESNHVRNRRGSGSGVSSMESDSSDGDKESETDTDEDVSTSEDAIYEEKVEPVFDVTKSLLLASYQKPKKPPEKAKAKFEEKIIEVETGSNKKLNVLNDVVTGVGAASNDSTLKGEDDRKIGMAVNEKDGPWFKDLGGIKEKIEQLKTDVLVPLYHPQLPRELGVRPMAGILLYGPPGCGKTKLARAIANETGVPFYEISATEVVSGVSGASEENIRNLFSKAYRTAPSVVFIDEIDAIASKRENLQREMERRIVTQLMTCMDESHRSLKPDDGNIDGETLPSHSKPGYVLVIGATNRPDAIDPSLRRPGRFDSEICLNVPDEESRAEILSVLTRSLKRDGSFDLHKIARATPGYVGADLEALTNKAGALAMERVAIEKRKAELPGSCVDEESAGEWWKRPWLPEEVEKLSITMADFEKAIGEIQPSSTREGFSAIPNVKWQDVGGLDPLKQAFDRYIVRRIKYPEEYKEFGVDLEAGFLLFGPPGCGKTLIAKAVANAAGANFIHIKGPELLTKYVGDSEQAVRTIFRRAKTCAPCILFFDEVDALTKQRGTEGGWVVEKVLNQLLIELDGADDRRNVFVIGATNRIEVIDRALLRPGRFGILHYVRLPSPEERCRILEASRRSKPIDSDVDLEAIGRMQACENFSGADLAALMNEAAMIALQEQLDTAGNSPNAPRTIKTRHFELALAKISPSVSPMDIQVYERLAKEFKAA
ncbi:hypothetical protein MLD38_002724 [Melastoma candidum]|uniref:Uncharacterized protein n=1 Tax=Melastoma candidum TaxID=119954 RepID=A0ACB9S0A6_9MYRT|nr:hypothetical protein MLD38_002724 [Melastoma candidum]